MPCSASDMIGPVSQTGSLDDVVRTFLSNPSRVFPFPVKGCPTFTDGAICTLHAGPAYFGGVGKVRVNTGSNGFLRWFRTAILIAWDRKYILR